MNHLVVYQNNKIFNIQNLRFDHLSFRSVKIFSIKCFCSKISNIIKKMEILSINTFSGECNLDRIMETWLNTGTINSE